MMMESGRPLRLPDLPMQPLWQPQRAAPTQLQQSELVATLKAMATSSFGLGAAHPNRRAPHPGAECVA